MKRRAGLAAAAQTEREDRSELRLADPRHLGARRQERRDRARVGDVALHAHRERLQAEQREPRIHGRHLRADVAQHFGSRAHQERVLAERLGEDLLMVSRARRREQRKASVVPRELARLDQDAADRRAVTVDELRRGVHDDVGAVLDRPAEIRRRERVVDDERDARLVREWPRTRANRRRRPTGCRSSRRRAASCSGGWPRARPSRSSAETKVVSIPIRLIVTLSCVTVPP